MTESFNFRSLGRHNSRKLVANRIKIHIEGLHSVYNLEQLSQCYDVLQKCIDFSNRKITNLQLIRIHEDFIREFFNKRDDLVIRSTLLPYEITETYLLMMAIKQCSSYYFNARVVLNLINGYAAIQSRWSIELERSGQIRAYNKYMQDKQITKNQQQNVLYPNRRITFAEKQK